MYVSIRKYAPACGVNPTEDLVQPIMFHLQMARAVDPPMYVMICYSSYNIYNVATGVQ